MVRPSTASVVPVTHPAYGHPDQRFGGGAGFSAVLVRPVDEPPLVPNEETLRPPSSTEQRLIDRLCVPAGLTPAGQRFVDRRRIDALSSNRPHSAPRPPVLRRGLRGRSPRTPPRHASEREGRQERGSQPAAESARVRERELVCDVGGSLTNSANSVKGQIQKHEQEKARAAEEQDTAIAVAEAEAELQATEATAAQLAKAAVVAEAKSAAEDARLEAVPRHAEAAAAAAAAKYDAACAQGASPTATAPIVQQAATSTEPVACAQAASDSKTMESLCMQGPAAAVEREDAASAEMQQSATARTLCREKARERAADALAAADELRRAEECEREARRLRMQPERSGARAVLPPLPAAAGDGGRTAATSTDHLGDVGNLDLSARKANIKQLRLYAKSLGASAAAIEAARDDDIPRAALTRLILSNLTIKELRTQARVAGATAEAIEDARDDDSPRNALTDLAVAAYCRSR